MLKITSTNDIDLFIIREALSGVETSIDVEVSERQTFYKAIDVPSWITLSTEWELWLKLGGGVIASTILANLTNDAYAGIKKVAKATKLLKSKYPVKTKINLSVPFPNEQQPIIMQVNGTTDDEIQEEIKLFITCLPKLKTLLIDHNISNDNIFSPIILSINTDKVITASWRERQNSSIQEYTYKIE